MRKIYGYARVSTREQNLDRQIIALQQYGISDRDIVTDKESGKTLERDGYTFLKNRLLRDGDVLVVKSLDRLSRNKNHIKQELEYFKSRNIRVMVLDIQTTLIDPPEGQEWIIEMINNILIEVLSSIAQQERETNRARQREGIDAAKLAGKNLGRPKVQVPDNFVEVIADWHEGKITAREAMRLTGLKRSSFYNLAKGGGD